jgi:alpha-mannosidase
MHDRRLLTEARLDRFVTERVVPALYRKRIPLSVSAWQPSGEPVSFAEAAAAPYEPISMGTRWGAPWSTMWLRVTGSVPVSWMTANGALPAGMQPELDIDLGFDRSQTGFQSEALLYRPDGSPIKAISPLNSYSRGAIDDEGNIDVFVEAAANPDVGSDWKFRPTTLGDLETAGDSPLYELTRVDLALLDTAVWELHQDILVLRGLMLEIPVGVPRRAEILAALERMLDTVDPDDVSGSALAGRRELETVLSKPAYASAHTMHAVGHAHIDSAWLWPIRETIRKCARTFSNMVTLMDENPGFTFACSSAQQLAWMKEFYPLLFERIKEKVAAGQFIPVGGMWVESDTNMPGSEALARQFVAGKTFFLEEFGIDCEEVWLPDSFGYSGALPQIVRSAGARWFLTQKISWNETNVMPHHSFQWEGIDGTRVFTHFPPVDKYNSDLVASDLAYAERNYADQGKGTMSLLPYGYGDGGGGPTREMIAIVERTKSLEASPRVVQSAPRVFFELAEAEYPDAPVWAGELYLEAQRGTYTSQLATKQGNRRSEHLLREAELWASTAAVRGTFAYPYEKLQRIWHTVLLQQFHDILPGSSIAWVHQDAERNYARLAVELEEIIDESIRSLAGSGTETLSFNAAPHERDGIPALGAGLTDSTDSRVQIVRSGSDFVLENKRVRARFDSQGLLVELRDLTADRDTIPPGMVGNLFQLHRDTPTKWDAWDIDFHYRHTVTDLRGADEVRIDDSGRSLIITRSFGNSHLLQTVTLDEISSSIDFELTVDWHEKQKLLKLAFPIDVHAERFASEIQFGHIERAIHTNTSWDAARFETCAHRWIRVAEPGYGVAIFNDSTYGYDITKVVREGGGTATVARLSILRAPLFPDPHQDLGTHTLRVSIAVGASVLESVVGGYRENLPARVVSGVASRSIDPLVTVSTPGVVVESVKLAEDGSGDVVVRLYEALGQRSRAAVTPDFVANGVESTDLLERSGSGTAELTVLTGTVAELALRPFEIVTLRFHRAAKEETS